MDTGHLSRPRRIFRAAISVALLLGAVALSLTLLRALQLGAAPRPDTNAEAVYRIPVSGVIELGLAPFIERSLREATAAGARAAVLEIETPGGRVDAAQRITNAIGDAEIPVYAYVNRHAFSAGALIALATERVYMRTGSVMGAATPVAGDGVKAPEKIVAAMRSEMRALAEARGLDPRIAEAMVDEDLEVEGVIERGRLLSLTTDEAVAIGYAVEVRDWDDLMAQLDLAGSEIRVTRVNWAESIVRFLTHPLVSPLLLSLGFLGLLFEIKTPGLGVPGLAGVTALGLFFGSHYLVGLAGAEELILLALGAVLLAVELFIIPGFGFFGVAGIAAILASIFMSFLGRFPTTEDVLQATAMLTTSILVMMIMGWAMARQLPSNRRLLRSGILLGETTSREAGYLSAAVRPELVGTVGVAATDLRPAGVGEFGDERLDVVADSGWIERGTPIRIIQAEGYRHVVRPAR
jgi:membrane-bound serine protease (ClpP class)